MNKHKQIFLVGLSTNMFLNISIEAVNTISKSQCVVVSKKFSITHINNIRRLCNIVIFEEDLIANGSNHLWKQIEELTKKFDVISHIKTNDPIFFSDGYQEFNYFRKKKIIVKIVSGTIDIIELLNKSRQPLTDRKKNSSVSFLYESNNFSIKNIIMSLKTDKLIINLSKQHDIEKIIGELKEQNKFKKISFVNNKIYRNISKKIDNLKILVKFHNESVLNNFLILER